jgi:hypothetical protein
MILIDVFLPISQNFYGGIKNVSFKPWILYCCFGIALKMQTLNLMYAFNRNNLLPRFFNTTELQFKNPGTMSLIMAYILSMSSLRLKIINLN